MTDEGMYKFFRCFLWYIIDVRLLHPWLIYKKKIVFFVQCCVCMILKLQYFDHSYLINARNVSCVTQITQTFQCDNINCSLGGVNWINHQWPCSYWYCLASDGPWIIIRLSMVLIHTSVCSLVMVHAFQSWQYMLQINSINLKSKHLYVFAQALFNTWFRLAHISMHFIHRNVPRMIDVIVRIRVISVI